MRKWLSVQPSFVHAVLLAALVGYVVYTITGIGHDLEYPLYAFILAAVDGVVFAVAWPLLRAVRGRW